MCFAMTTAAAALIVVWGAAQARAAEAGKLPEPQYASTVYWIDGAGAKLATLDRQRMVPVAKSKAFGYGGMKSTLQVEGPMSSVRFAAGQKVDFVFQLPGNLDPQTVAEIVPLDAKKDHREMIYMESKGLFGMGGVKAGSEQGDLPFETAKYSETSIKISPASPLQAGRICRAAHEVSGCFCFGVDAR